MTLLKAGNLFYSCFNCSSDICGEPKFSPREIQVLLSFGRLPLAEKRFSNPNMLFRHISLASADPSRSVNQQ